MVSKNTDKKNGNSIRVISVKELLSLKLQIPNYQRPYKWASKNISELLNDFEHALSESKKISNYKYRIGTVLLHKKEDCFDIVDGQQRTISLALLMHYLKGSIDIPLLNSTTYDYDEEAQFNIYRNYSLIKDRLGSLFRGDNQLKTQWIDLLEKNIELVKIEVNDLTESFQLFDSQNFRGKELYPHDLLKAYHLREIKSDEEMKEMTEKWERFGSKNIKNLFDKYLFPIYNWSKRKKTTPFTVNEIVYFKGITVSTNYTYAKRAERCSPYFQIGEPFISGRDFFLMVEHYESLRKNLENEIRNNTCFENISDIINECQIHKSVGFDYALTLFECVLLYYYDKFNDLNSRVVHKLFVWSMIIRCYMQNLGYATINKYATGEKNTDDSYVNNIDMFFLISTARTISDISDIQVRIKKEDSESPEQNKSVVEKWDKLLYKKLCDLVGDCDGE